MSKSTWLSIACLIIGAWLVTVNPVGPVVDPVDPVISDTLAESYKNDRAARVEILTRMQSMEFTTNGDAADWFNAEILPARAEAFAPFTDSLAEAIDAGTITDLLEVIK